MPNEVKTLSPDTGLSGDISVSDLGALLGGSPAATAAPAVTPAATETKATPAEKPAETKVEATAPEAGTDETPVAEPGEKKPEAEEQTAEKSEKSQKSEKKDEKWWDKRLSNLAAKRREAEAKATAEATRAEKLQRELESLKAKPGPATTPSEAETPVTTSAKADAKPELAKFVSALKDGEAYEVAVERYTEAVSDWKDEQKTIKAVKEQQQQAFSKDWDAALAVHPDFEDVVARVRSAAPEGLQVAVTQVQDQDGKNMWPELTMYLDEHTDVLESLGKQYNANPIAAAARLGRIAASLSSPTKTSKPNVQTETPVKTEPKVAPKPPATVGGTAAPGVVDLQQADMGTFAREMSKLGF